MTTEEPNLADALVKAIKAERDGHSFYSMAANASQDPKGRDVFLRLAAEELEHASFLARQHESVLKTGGPDASIKLGAPVDLAGMSPIFSEGIKSRIKDAHFEMSALSIGIQLELDAMNFYKSHAGATKAPAAKAFFTELADWESGHYQALLRQQEELKEDYWSDSGFAPF